ncbi:MAG: radical SAM protein [Bacteroidetes bacterium]|nr:MAG: radical SAM protein [Bacteroidota bacterium]
MEGFYGTPQSHSGSQKHAQVMKGPIQVAFDITNKCNFRCAHCYNNSGENNFVSKELSDDEVLNFIHDIAKLKPFNFCFCGGEPLLRLDVLLKSAKILASHGVIVSLVTNGFLLTENIAANLYKNGVKRVQVSIDGSNPESHEKLRRVPKSFDRAINAVRHFRKAGFKDISVAFCPTKFNYSEIEQVYELCLSLGVKDLRVQPMMPLGRASQNLDFIPSVYEYRKIVSKIMQLRNRSCDKIMIDWGDPVDHLVRFRTITQHCVAYVSILADGSIAVSPYIPLLVGNIRRHSFSDYWEAGLARIWELPMVKKYADPVFSVTSMGKKREGEPHVWFDEPILVDIVENQLI